MTDAEKIGDLETQVQNYEAERAEAAQVIMQLVNANTALVNANRALQRQLLDKRGSLYHFRHILLRPVYTMDELNEGVVFLDSIANQIRKATQLQQAYDVEGVPSMGVAGRYYVDGTMAGSMENVLRIVEQLAAQVRKG